MNLPARRIVPLAALTGAVLLLAGCGDVEGSIADATAGAKDAIEQADEAAQDARERLERAVDEADERIDDLQEGVAGAVEDAQDAVDAVTGG